MAYNQTDKDLDWEDEVGVNLIDVCPIVIAPESWYKDLVYYLQQGYPPEHWSSKQRRELRSNSSPYQIMDGVLFKKNYDGVFLRCLEREDASKIVIELHDEPAGGNYSGDTIAHKILRAGYYWQTLFKYSHAYARKCDVCQRSGGKLLKAAGSLQPVTISDPFEQWGINVIGEINMNYSLQH